MSGIAEILLSMGYKVTGSDMTNSEVVERLRGLGASITIGHDATYINHVDAVVVSSAISTKNVEYMEAMERGLPIVPRAEMLAELMRLKYSIAIAGTHGKTTTTSMAAIVLTEAGLDPTVIIGGRLEHLGSGARAGRGDYLVAEADESDGSFLKLSPTVAVITNIDDDHLEYYGDMANLTATFLEFANKVPFYGFSVLCGDDPRLRSIISNCNRRVITYGFGADLDLRGDSVELGRTGSSFDLIYGQKNIGRVNLKQFGTHNVANALATAAVGLELGIEPDNVISGLEAFTGVDRRLQFKGKGNQNGNAWTLYDDYGHHPTEITATLSAVKGMDTDRTVVIFQPHRFTRTELLYDKLAMALVPADKIWLLPIYAAGESPRQNISSHLISEALMLKGHANFELLEPGDDGQKILEDMKKNDLVITLGAGDVNRFGEELLGRSQ